MDFDVSQFELKDTSTLVVQNAAGTDDLLVDGQPVRIELYGAGSAQGIAAKYKADNAAQQRMQAVFRGKTVKNGAQDAEQELIDRLVECTASISNFPITGGARALYSNPKLGYIRKQVVKFLDDDGNFSKA